MKIGVFKMVDEEKVKEAIRLLLEGIGEDPSREGLKDTPERVARMYTEVLSGMEESAAQHLSRTFSDGSDGIVLERDITFYSTCEHHLMPFYGKAHIAYLPKGKVVGLSKLARTVEVFARRLQMQERMTAQIADAVEKELYCRGVMVLLEAEHTCMTMRGVKKPGSKTVTVACRGVFEEDRAMQERFYRMLEIRS